MTDAILPSADAAEHRKSPFADSAGLPQFQVAWDSTSLGLFKECPRKYYYEIILGWRPKGTSVHLKFGQLYHAGMEAYDHFAASLGKLAGGLSDDEHDEGIHRSIRHVLDLAATWTKCAECKGTGRWPQVPEPLGGATVEVAPEHRIPTSPCEACRGKGKTFVQGWLSGDPYKNMWTLCRSIVWYLDVFRNSPLRTVTLSNGKPAVELSFYFPAGDLNGIPFAFCGHLDRVVTSDADGGRASIHDRKTTKGQLNARYWAGFNPHNQFTLYTAAGTIHYSQPTFGITVDAAQVTVNATAYERKFIPYPPALVDEWLAEANVWISLAYRYAEMGVWPKNDKSCGSYGGCPFIPVCSKSPTFRQRWLEADFKPERWNPLEVRGDI